MAEDKPEIKDQKEPEKKNTAPEKAENPDSSNRKRRALVVYLSIIFAAAFLLVAISLIVRMHTMKEDFAAVNSQADMSYAALEDQAQDLESQAQLLEEKARASELLTLAQNAYYKEDIQGFHGYMEALDQCSNILSQDMKQIYEDLKIIEGELK